MSLHQPYVGTEHLLLGVLTEPGGASGVLKGITLDAARNEIIQILGRGEDSVQGKQMVYTPRTKKVLEQSVREARELKQNYVSTEHMLLALMREREVIVSLKANAVLPSVCGILNGLSNHMVLVLTGMMSTAIYFPLLSASSLVISFILSLTVYKEKLLVRQMVAAGMSIVAIILLNI